jgi:hypothetical protein
LNGDTSYGEPKVVESLVVAGEVANLWCKLDENCGLMAKTCLVQSMTVRQEQWQFSWTIASLNFST